MNKLQEDDLLPVEDMWIESKLPLTTLGGQEPIGMFKAHVDAQILYITGETGNSELIDYLLQRINRYFPDAMKHKDHRIVMRSGLLGNPALPKLYFEKFVNEEFDEVSALSLARNPSTPTGLLTKIYEKASIFEQERRLAIARCIAHNKNASKELLRRVMETTDPIIASIVRKRLNSL